MGLSRIKIGIGILGAFLISSILMRYMTFTDKPTVDVVKAKEEVQTLQLSVSATIASVTSQITSPIQSMFVARKVEPTTAPLIPSAPTASPMEFASLPTKIPTPTYAQIDIIPTVTTAPYEEPTVAQETPTEKPKPTNPPVSTPTPLAPAEYLRPGKDLDEIFKLAGELSCFPAPILKAFVAQEGPGALTYGTEKALFYNAYDWWHRVTTKQQVCSGYGYYPETGLIAEDSLFANEKCKDPFSPETANDVYSKSLGATQILQYYWDNTYKSKVQKILNKDKVDRRVLFDALVGFGVAFKEGTKYSGSCSDWDLKYIMKAACINAGNCDNYNYCYTICKNYNKFSGQNNNCDNVKGLFVPGSCEFK